MEMLLDLALDLIEGFGGIVFDFFENKIERAKCIKRPHKRKKRLSQESRR